MEKIVISKANQFIINENTLKIYSGNDVKIIDLQKCHQNWKHIHKIEENEYRGIGERDICADPPYFLLFHSQENTKIAFQPGLLFGKIFKQMKHKKAQKLFHLFYNELMRNKWTTLDLT
jgi:hypothetical protein